MTCNPYTEEGRAELEACGYEICMASPSRYGEHEWKLPSVTAYRGSETDLRIPDGVVSIADHAFRGHERLRRVILPATLYEMGSGVFAECPQLEEVVFTGNMIGEIPYETFWNCPNLRSVVLPSELQIVESMAFSRCKSLTRMELPDTLYYIGNEAFGWSGLTEVFLPRGLRSIDTHAFYHCPHLCRVVFAEGCTSVGDEMFRGCTQLAEAAFPSTMNHIGIYAFDDTALREVTLPHGCVDLAAFPCRIIYEAPAKIRSNRPYRTLTDTAKAAVQSLGLDCLHDTLTAYRGKAETLVIPRGIGVIGCEAFRGCETLRRVEIPDTVEILEDNCFADCAHLEEVVIRGDRIERFPCGAFRNCYALREVTIPPKLRAFGDASFDNCESLTLVDMPATVSTIGYMAFSGTGIEEIFIPHTVSEWEEKAFAYCTDLKLAELEEGITVIPPEAFNGCCALKRVVIPSTVKSVGIQAFWDTALTSVTLPKGCVEWEAFPCDVLYRD